MIFDNPKLIVLLFIPDETLAKKRTLLNGNESVSLTIKMKSFSTFDRNVRHRVSS